MNSLKGHFLGDVLDFINNLSLKDQYKIRGAVNALEKCEFQSVYIKQLKGDIKELRVKRYRLIFFIHEHNICFVRIFIKKTNKTSKREIELALKSYKLFINKNIL